MRGYHHCERFDDLEEALEEGSDPIWVWTLLTWMVHVAAVGKTDFLSGLPLNCDGSFTYFAPTLLAHKVHGRPFFCDEILRQQVDEITIAQFVKLSNATVQSWATNLFIGSMRGSRLLQSVVASRGDCVTFLQRLRTLGIIGDAQLDTLTAGPVLDAQGVALLRTNGLEYFEHPSK